MPLLGSALIKEKVEKEFWSQKLPLIWGNIYIN